ncbi:hypothetical protein CBR_g55444 [Chara braunii]|uniref:Uncharacterized protein n=1 Tax=Chara braunii TaxID=69332 RepID=A0A388K7T9_CHABU|nr:hypothetical protein CBR_g55444 [Chara braunii]|eukprot:GBG66101.1 hypothetical protein CBR_g55444 [Chara braunii]
MESGRLWGKSYEELLQSDSGPDGGGQLSSGMHGVQPSWGYSDGTTSRDGDLFTPPASELPTQQLSTPSLCDITSACNTMMGGHTPLTPRALLGEGTHVGADAVFTSAAQYMTPNMPAGFQNAHSRGPLPSPGGSSSSPGGPSPSRGGPAHPAGGLPQHRGGRTSGNFGQEAGIDERQYGTEEGEEGDDDEASEPSNGGRKKGRGSGWDRSLVIALIEAKRLEAIDPEARKFDGGPLKWEVVARAVKRISGRATDKNAALCKKKWNELTSK